MGKTDEVLEVQAAREARVPDVGTTVYYCATQPNVDEDGTPNPAREEDWLSADVLGVERIERTEDPDDWVALLDTPVGPIGVAVSLLRDAPPTEDELPRDPDDT